MSVFAHSHLFLGPSTATVVSGPHIQVLDAQTGALLHSITDDASPILCAAVDDAYTHVVSVCDNKKLRVRALPDLRLLSEREVPKKSTDLILTRDGSTILVSDKFGDVHRYPLHTSAAVVEESTDDDAAPASLVLGHTSLLTTLLLSPDEKYLLTADRDEHVRVSWFPQAFIIEAFCLGHTKFVSAIHIPPSSPDHLISGGGDPELRVWEWRTGRALAKLPVRDAVIPHIAVIPSREKRPILRKDGKPAGRKGRKKAQQAAAAQAVSKEAEADKNTDKMDADDVEEGTSADVPSTAPTDAPTEPVLVIQRIATISDGSADTTVVFSTTGATALFTAPFAPTESGPVSATPLGAPVLDFVLSGAHVWALLDAPRGSTGGPSVKRLLLSGGELREDPSTSPLLVALNTSALLPMPAGAPVLDPYTTLSSLPKLPGADDSEESESRPVGQAPARGKHVRQRQKAGPTAREEARKKLRERVRALASEGSAPATPSGSEPPEKRTRVDGEAEEDEDEEMQEDAEEA